MPSKNLTERIREVALTYRRAGWNVIPLRHYEKSPASANALMPTYWEKEGRIVEVQPDNMEGWNKKQGWKPLQNRLATDEEFTAMFAGSDITGIGAITGTVSDLYVLDEDSYKAGGKEVVRKSPLIAATPNGGKHYFFKHDQSVEQVGLRNQVFIEGKGDGGFVVLCPSMVIKKDGKKGSYRWVHQCKIADIPKISKADITFIPEEEQRRLTEGGTIPFAELMEVSEGNRHNSMRELMTKKLNITKPETWDGDVLHEIKMYNEGYQPPLKNAEMEKLWRDTKRFVLNNPPNWLRKYLAGNKGQPIVEEPVPDKINKPRGLRELAQERIKERELEKEAASTGYVELDYLVKGFIPGHLYTLTGETNIGKTAMCANFAVNVARQGKNVLYIALEPDTMIMEYVASVMHKKRYDTLTPQDLVDAAEADGHIHVYGQKEIPSTEHLVKAIEEDNQYQLVIVDHIGYFVKDQRNTYQDQANTIKKLALLAKQKRIPIILIAHINKEASKKNKPLTYNDISGSAAFKQDSTDVWLLERGDRNSGLPKGQQRGWADYTEEGFIKIAKSKSGKNGEVEVRFREGKALVEEPGESDSQDISHMF